MRCLRFLLLLVFGLSSTGALRAEPVSFMAGWIRGATLNSSGGYGLGGSSAINMTFGAAEISYINQAYVPSFGGTIAPASALLASTMGSMSPGSVNMGPILGGDGLYLFGINHLVPGGVQLTLPDGVATFNVHFGTGGVQTGVTPASWNAQSSPFPGAEVGPNSITVLGEVTLVSNTSSTDFSQFMSPDGGLIALTYFSDDPTLDVVSLLENGGSFTGDGAVQFIALGSGTTGNGGQQVPEPATLLLWAGLGLGGLAAQRRYRRQRA